MSAPLLDSPVAEQGVPTRAPEDQRPAPLPSDALLRGRRVVEISHNGEVYRLQATRLGKLILTK
jgi:hemin uptake protein HemP